jgi:hypothetical protein
METEKLHGIYFSPSLFCRWRMRENAVQKKKRRSAYYISHGFFLFVGSMKENFFH